MAQTAQGGTKPRYVASYIYKLADGTPYLRVSRTEPKGPFPQSHWVDGKWESGKPYGPKIPYRLPEMLASGDAPVFICEGEKDADALQRLGLIATTNSEGAGCWTGDLDQHFAGRVVFILADNDDAGAKHARRVAEHLAPVASDVRVVDLPGLPVKGDVSDWLAAGGDAAQLADICQAFPAFAAAPQGAAPDTGDVDPWLRPDLSLLGTGRRPAPDFPLDLFGPYWSAWVTRRAAGASSPVDYVGVSLLACAGAMIANVRWPVAGANWSEPPVLWAGIVGSPSASKSPAMDAAFDLVQHAEDRMAAGFDQENRRFETMKQIAKAKRDCWESEVKAVVKAGGIPPDMPDDAAPPDDPVRPRVRVADFTIEKLGALAAALPRGLLVVRDELAGWLGAFDKYGGGGSDRAFAIEMYGGRSYIVDRVKNPEPLRIRHLSVGILGGVQPDKLSVIIEGPDDGLASRILWSWPEALPQFSLSRTKVDDGDARSAFARLADLQMGTDEFGFPEPNRLRLEPQAEDVLEDFACDMAQRGNETSGIFSGALGKARGHALRLATVIEFLWWCGTPGVQEPQIISAKAMMASAGLLDGYFIPMAERVHGDAAIPVAERGAMILGRYLKRNGLVTFNARDVRREIGGALRETPAMNAACEVLIEAGLLRPQFSRAGENKGRQAKNFEVNPAVFGASP